MIVRWLLGYLWAQVHDWADPQCGERHAAQFDAWRAERYDLHNEAAAMIRTNAALKARLADFERVLPLMETRLERVECLAASLKEEIL